LDNIYYKCQNNCIGNIRSEDANAQFENYLKAIQIPVSVCQLYPKVMEDIFKTKEGDKKEKNILIEQNLREVEKGIEKVNEEYFINQRMDEATFNKVTTQFTNKKADLAGELVELKAG
jgi:hypothetical protein